MSLSQVRNLLRELQTKTQKGQLKLPCLLILDGCLGYVYHSPTTEHLCYVVVSFPCCVWEWDMLL